MENYEDTYNRSALPVNTFPLIGRFKEIMKELNVDDVRGVVDIRIAKLAMLLIMQSYSTMKTATGDKPSPLTNVEMNLFSSLVKADKKGGALPRIIKKLNAKMPPEKTSVLLDGLKKMLQEIGTNSLYDIEDAKIGKLVFVIVMHCEASIKSVLTDDWQIESFDRTYKEGCGVFTSSCSTD